MCVRACEYVCDIFRVHIQTFAYVCVCGGKHDSGSLQSRLGRALRARARDAHMAVSECGCCRRTKRRASVISSARLRNVRSFYSESQSRRQKLAPKALLCETHHRCRNRSVPTVCANNAPLNLHMRACVWLISDKIATTHASGAGELEFFFYDSINANENTRKRVT